MIWTVVCIMDPKSVYVYKSKVATLNSLPQLGDCSHSIEHFCAVKRMTLQSVYDAKQVPLI